MSLPLSPSFEPLLPELVGLRKPRLRTDIPILWRDQSSIQLGDDVIVDRVTRAHVAWIASLDGMRVAAEIEDDLFLPLHEARRLLRALLAAAALDDATRIPDALRWCSQDDRDRTAGRFGAALRTYRSLDDTYVAMAARDRCTVAVVGTDLLADEVCAALDAAGLALTDRSDATLTVLADARHPDVPTQFDHEAQQGPHLPVSVLGERATAGPLVIPGRTGCLRCAHLHRRDADAAWPLLAVQWAQSLAGTSCRPVDPLLVRLAAAHAVLLIRMWVDAPQRTEDWAGFAIDLRLPAGQTTRVARPAHPLCGCRWPQG
jgi:bacteriocin biosynthesis cyclodehydratase domain-containing protein